MFEYILMAEIYGHIRCNEAYCLAARVARSTDEFDGFCRLMARKNEQITNLLALLDVYAS